MASKNPIKDLSQYEHVMSKVKALLKARKITYIQLASRLGLSESGLKKVLNARDGSFERITEISRELGVALSDLLEEKSSEIYPVSFTPAQQELFLKTPLAFEVFWKLVYERRTLEAITTAKKMEPKEIAKILRALDSLDLVQWKPGGKVRVPDVVPVSWVGDGPFLRKIFREWSHRFIDTMAGPERHPDRCFFFRYLQMTEETYRDLLKAQADLELEYLKRSVREMQMGFTTLRHVRWLAAIDDKSFYS